MTAVLFKFANPDGTPVADAPFRVTTRKPSFDETLRSGIQVPGDVEGLTDAQGEATLELMAGFATYYLLMDRPGVSTDADGCVAGLRYRFMVTESDDVLRVEDLIVTTPTFSRPWDEVALQIIIDAKASSQVSADAAKQSELAAGVFAQQAEDAIEATRVNAESAAASATAAHDSSVASGESAAAALVARNEAEDLRDESHTHANSANNSARAAGVSAAQASDFVDEAGTFAAQSKASANASKLSENAAAASEQKTAADARATAQDVVTSGQNKDLTAADVVTVTGLKSDVTTLKNETKTYRDEALAALGSITGVISDGGAIDMSSNAYPPKPNTSTMWRVTVPGDVDGIDYKVGDQLFYTKDQDYFYKLDGTENVHSVAGRTGDVILDKADVGLDRVNNTNDLEKPISTAAQAQFTARTPTANSLDTTANRLVRVGGYGRNGGAPVARIAADDANTLTVSALYLFAAGGVNVPEPAYVDHIPGTTAGYAKQIAYGYLTDKQYVRTQSNNVWSVWTSAVEIIDALTSSDATKALSARQGKVLYDLLLANNTTLTKFYYNVAQGQTVITGPDSQGNSLAYVPGTPFLADKDGFAIQVGKDYTASTGTSITLTTAAEQASEVSITVFGAFTVADHYTKAESNAQIAALGLKSASKADIVGPVTQASGIPTGAIIERGSNANGEYTKYADGTLICTRRRPMTRALQTAAGSALFSTAVGETQVDYPLAFISPPTEIVTVVGESFNAWWSAFGVATNITSSAGFIINHVSRASSAYVVNYLWLGRWF